MLRKDTSPIESNAANWVCSDLQPDAAMSIPVPYRRVMRRIVSVYWLMVDVEGRREVSLADFRSIRLEKRSGLNCRVFFVASRVYAHVIAIRPFIVLYFWPNSRQNVIDSCGS